MKVQGPLGSGSIRGIGADQRVEHQTVPGVGQVSVFQLFAQFPGHTAPRDFVTLLLSSEAPYYASPDDGRPLRQFMLISKPCVHSECPPRPEIIRGQYESVEIFREIPGESPVSKRSLSHTPICRRRRAAGHRCRRAPCRRLMSLTTDSSSGSWLPGATRAAAFLASSSTGALRRASYIAVRGYVFIDCKPDRPAVDAELKTRSESGAASSTKESPNIGKGEANSRGNEFDGSVYGAVGVATSLVHGQQQSGTPADLGGGDGSSNRKSTDDQQIAVRVGDDESVSDASSECSFASAMEKSTSAVDKGGSPEAGSDSDESRAPPVRKGLEKELRKLKDQQHKLDMSFAEIQQRLETKQRDEAHKDAAAQAKARDRHERELAKHQAKYQRDMNKLADRRAQYEFKAELRRRKTADKEDRTRLALELDRARAEHDVAKRAELLQRQVNELQAQNTTFVTRLSRLEDMSRNYSSSTSSKNSV